MGKLYGSITVICSDGKERVAHYTTKHARDAEHSPARIKVKGKTVAGTVFMDIFYPDRDSSNGQILPYWEDEIDLDAEDDYDAVRRRMKGL